MALSAKQAPSKTTSNDLDWYKLIDLSLKQITAEQIAQKRVKVVATIGPASENPKILRQMIRNGMDVARLNFSHGNHSDHKRRLDLLRQSAKQERKYLGILQDIQGPKIRVGRFENGQVELKRNQNFIITTDKFLGNSSKVSCTLKNLHGDIKPGHRILLDDGLIFLVVEAVRGHDIHTRVVFGGILKDSKGMNLPDTKVNVSCLTLKDRNDIVFGLRNGVDFIALSFIQSAEDVIAARRFIHRYVAHAPALIAKVESSLAVQDIDRIIEASDGVMVARGDLGVECPLEQVPAIQKQIIQMANRAGKFVITATQMLESMTSKPRPTRAEASDVANAVLDGTDAVMLSAESASGDFPLESITTMSRIIVRTEEYSETKKETSRDRFKGLSETAASAVTAAAVQATQTLPVSAIVAFTHSGATAQSVSRFRPPLPILALTPFEKICRRMAIVWGVIPHIVKIMKHTDDMPVRSRPTLEKMGLWKEGHYLAFLSGTPVNKPGTTNLLKIYQVK